ncbi:transporter [Segetibacter aerophilus]|nr:transporter [Segetibacter aerophilus]
MKKTLLLLSSFLSLTIYAQDKIEAERPSESLSPKTVVKKSFQAEIGFRKTQENEQDKVWRQPNALFRYGVFDKLELRLETTVADEKLVSENEFKKGLKPVEIGLKLNFFETKNEAFSSSIVGQIGIPKFASPDHKIDKAYNRVRLLFENKLSEKLKLNYNVGSEWDSEDQEQNWMYSFTPEFEISDKWESYVEVYGFAKKGKTPEDVFDAGIAYFVSKNSKLDLSGGVGLNEESPHYFVAAGISFRFGGKK